MSENLARIEKRNGYAILTLNRPEALNALSLALEAALLEAVVALDADPDVRAIVVTGAGRAFSVGVDLKELSEGDGMAGRVWHGAGSLGQAMRDCATPLIAAVNGFAVTGGLELALQCDFLLAAEGARFADTHARVGITPSWGLTQILPRLTGPARAKQMSLTGQFVDAATARDWGLVNEVLPPDALMDRACAIAAEIAETDVTAQTRILALMDEGMSLGLDDALTRERAVFDHHMASVTPAMIAESRKAVQARGKRVTGGA